MPNWPKKKPRPGVDRYGRSPLWEMASVGDTAGVSRELAAGGDPNSPDDAGYTLLHITVQERHVEMAELLLRSGADPNRADKRGNGPLFTAVMAACRADRTEANLTLVALLLRSGADPAQKNNIGRSPLEMAGISGDEPVQTLFAELVRQ